jgi:hypothetical protein
MFCRSLFVLFLLNRQYNGQKKKDKQLSTKHYTEGHAIQWPKEKGQTMIYKTLHRRTDNTMVKRKRTNNDLLVCSLSFDHCIVRPSV